MNWSESEALGSDEVKLLHASVEKTNGDKIDLVSDSEANSEQVNKIKDDRNFLGYYKTSAKTGNGVYEAFQAIIKELYNRFK